MTIDLTKVDAKGRLDALAAKALERVTSDVIPELKPLLDPYREEIHARLNEVLGPHKFDLSGIVDHVDAARRILTARKGKATT